MKHTLTPEELEDLLEGLTIEDPMTPAQERYFLKQLPPEEPTGWDMGLAQEWLPGLKNWYDNQPYDRVLVSSLEERDNAVRQLADQCKHFSVEPVGEIYQSGGYWCLRVRAIEEDKHLG